MNGPETAHDWILWLLLAASSQSMIGIDDSICSDLFFLRADVRAEILGLPQPSEIYRGRRWSKTNPAVRIRR